jgi:hypothetical protein
MKSYNFILPVDLYGCEIWSLKPWEGHRLRVCENRVLWKIYGTKRDKVARDWRKLSNEELHNLYASRNIIRVGAMMTAYKVLVGDLKVSDHSEDTG